MIVIAPDKFKGSLSAAAVARAVADGLAPLNLVLKIFPMADGGDGFAELMGYYTGAVARVSAAQDALGRPLQAGWQWRNNDKTAILEVAAASGLVLLKEEERNPLRTSTLGTGLQIKTAIDEGATHIILGLGGSATNDGGAGILAALGFQLLDAGHVPLPPIAQSLPLVEHIIPPKPLPMVRFTLACDVDNPLTGPHGASAVYAPQKGASPRQIKQLDEGLQHWAAILSRHTGVMLEGIPALGAAGGIAAALLAYFAVTLKPGIELVVESSGLLNVLDDAQLLITGEGRLDGQTASGKVVSYLAGLANGRGLPCHVICGKLDIDQAALQQMGIGKALSLVDNNTSVETAIKNAAALIRQKAPQLL